MLSHLFAWFSGSYCCTYIQFGAVVLPALGPLFTPRLITSESPGGSTERLLT